MVSVRDCGAIDGRMLADELGWLPEDLDAWLRCPSCASGGGDLLVSKYPVTNVQYARFVADGGYETPACWSEEGWHWRTEARPEYRGEAPVLHPHYWRDPRLGQERLGYPVVGVSWYEADAFCRWLTGLLRRAREGDPSLPEADRALVDGLVETGAQKIRLSKDKEWTALAGQTADSTADRYPWDPPEGPATKDEAAILARANTHESRLGGTSPVAMYPLGSSRPFGLMDMAGNVWEWTESWYEQNRNARVLRGGSSIGCQAEARCLCRGRLSPGHSLNSLGFRCVSPLPLCARPGELPPNL